MINIIGKKNWYYLFSLVVIIPGLISLLLYGLNLSIDFTGGTRITYILNRVVDKKVIAQIEDVLRQEKVRFNSIQPSGRQVLLRTAPITQKENTVITNKLQKNISSLKQ
jgi:preprotein translocase subunit SecF